MSMSKRTNPSLPWKGIYGRDRKYTARVDRMTARLAAPEPTPEWTRFQTEYDPGAEAIMRAADAGEIDWEALEDA